MPDSRKITRRERERTPYFYARRTHIDVAFAGLDASVRGRREGTRSSMVGSVAAVARIIRKEWRDLPHAFFSAGHVSHHQKILKISQES